MFAVKEPAQKVAALKALFAARKLAKLDDPKLLPGAFQDEIVLVKRV